MSSFNGGQFNINFNTDVETPLEPMLKSFYVVMMKGVKIGVLSMFFVFTFCLLSSSFIGTY